MRKFCEVCGKEVETKIITKKESYEVYGDTVDVEAQILVCTECEEEFFCEELDGATLVNAYNEYRKKHKLLLPEEIKAIREQYGLSQRSFAKLLNWGDKTIHRYENGAIQDKAHNSMLQFLKKPENMQTYLEENEILLEGRQKEKLHETVEQLLCGSSEKAGSKLISLMFNHKESIENGFKSFDYDKFCAMVLYFAQKNGKILKTKLLKLLNYSDMIFYKENGISISGAKYVHLPYGPVVQDFDILFGKMSADRIAHIEVEFDNKYEKHQVVPQITLFEGVLSNEERDVMDRVYNKFKSFGSVEISNYSHQEKGYRETKKGEVISYAYAKDIELDS